MKLLPLSVLFLLAAVPAAAQSIGARYDCAAAPNSTGAAATIAVSGSDVVGGNSLTLTATGLPPNQFGMFVVSATRAYIVGPGGSQGNLCVGGNIGRFKNQIANSGATGTITASVDTLSLPTTPAATILGGETWNFQAWYRDLGPSSNFTDAVAVGFRDSGITADFTASTVSGTAPLNVDFTYTGSGASSHSWAFGDGNSSTAMSPTHVFSNPGVYLVQHVTNGASGAAAKNLRVEVDASSGPVTFSDVYADFLVLDPNVGLTCVDCHGSGGFGGLNMSTEALAYANLVGAAANCGSGNTRVIAGDPNGSLLYQKLAGTQTCGQSMPFGSAYTGDLAKVFDWIAQGAQP